ncbi:glycoside hydrolase domain-containing protein [Yinghuangia seranimata]|uniref:glycoside hydrolase domain-containing protein n=1 Tax=Yinghuangia seranimata TaxID=408067 RepID=UPI00248C7D0F|nr:glycoside hydrolase domain-containing protein [Yinghuangia seranimata]MDI2130394.1 DUF1906 domain-containing protein [Yinghuangia seranimata]
MRRILRVGTTVALTVLLLAYAVPSADAARARPRGMRTVAGAAFDTCEAQPVDAMQAWRASPYKAVGIYVGGVNRGCANRGLTREWVRRVHAQGWEFLPIYVGAQASCSTSRKSVRIDPARSWDMGRADADDAVDRAAAVGFARGSAIYFDMEHYDNRNADCRRDVLNFVSAWSERVRARGYTAGYYSSLSSGIADLVRFAGTRAMPDAIWYARWDDRASTATDDIPDQLWRGRRVHQHHGNVQETYGGVTVNIDRNALDGPVGVL